MWEPFLNCQGLHTPSLLWGMVGNFRDDNVTFKYSHPCPPPNRRNESSKANETTGLHWAGVRGQNRMPGGCRSWVCAFVYTRVRCGRERSGGLRQEWRENETGGTFSKAVPPGTFHAVCDVLVAGGVVTPCKPHAC